ncbi:hypothetical protein DFH06DRAFT_1329226 [Mycena polygramma]|nr:hypothetical protein DFH06DRAFT_1329226 [Mycena polygramma]
MSPSTSSISVESGETAVSQWWDEDEMTLTVKKFITILVCPRTPICERDRKLRRRVFRLVGAFMLLAIVVVAALVTLLLLRRHKKEPRI